MAYYNPYQYLDYNPADGYPQFWTCKKVSFVASLSLIFLLITVSLRPWAFVFISMVAASLTMSFDYEGAFMDYIWRLITIVALVFLFWFLIWCSQKVKRPRSRSNEVEDDDEDDESMSVYVSLGLIAIFALVLTWCVQKLQRPRRRRNI
ncbi:hypothetical protein PVL29_014015 [Vitis rotundifolia]|uniref:Uncharacterized protein n=1 Tax=Vitis rotundifolia TaxID=103349 RepID=A0AA39DKD3_VITRO|nr:hypothetical protein PVL29_014015 [Vitis rotundifolia]